MSPLSPLSPLAAINCQKVAFGGAWLADALDDKALGLGHLGQVAEFLKRAIRQDHAERLDASRHRARLAVQASNPRPYVDAF